MLTLTLIYINRQGNLTNTLCTLCLKGWGFHAKPVFCFNIYIGNLYFDALIIGLFYICLVIGQTFGEGTLKKVFAGVLRERWGVSSA